VAKSDWAAVTLPDFQILRRCETAVASGLLLCALETGVSRALLSAGKKLLKRREIALRLGQVSRLQILPEQLKALLNLLLVWIRSSGRTNLAEYGAGNSKMPMCVSSFQAAWIL